jgi:Ser/Thr protein kinase RdoA (MazF antagonist)
MDPSQVQRAVEAGSSTASALGLRVEGAVVVHNSNRVVVRLAPCDVLARVRPLVHQAADDLEVEVARRLTETGSPVAEVAVVRLHAGLRQLEVRAPHFTDRVAEAQRLIADPAQTPELAGPDRELLGDILRRLGIGLSGPGTGEQVLHGEPHAGNLLRTRDGLLFADFETCCRGPVEFDLAHGLLPDEDGHLLPAADVCEHYPGASQDLIDQCRLLIWAMITTWRWQRDDQLPNGRYWRIEGLNQIRAALNGPGPDVLGDHT